MKKKIVLKEAGVLLIVAVMVLSTMVVTGNVAVTMMDDTLLFEGLEAGVMPPAGWTEVPDVPGNTWRISDTAHTGNYAAEYGYDTAGGSSLISPIIDCSDHEGLMLEFWHLQLGEDLHVFISGNGGNTWFDLDIPGGDLIEYTHRELDISDYAGNNQVVLKFYAGGAGGFSRVFLDDILVTGGEGGFQGTAEPLGDAVVTEENDGYIISNIGDSGDDGILLTPTFPQYGFTYDMYYSDNIPVGTIMTTECVFSTVTGEWSTTMTQEWEFPNEGPYGQSFSNIDEAGIIATWGDDVVFEGPIGPDGFCGKFTLPELPELYAGLTPNGGPYGQSFSNIDEAGIIDIGQEWNEETIEWEWEGEVYLIDCFHVKAERPDLEEFINCSITAAFPIDLSTTKMNTGEFATKHIRASDPPTLDDFNGETNGKAGKEYTYNLKATDSNENMVYYLIYWGDDTDSGWIGPCISGETTTAKHTWSEQGTYTVRAKAKDIYGFETDWEELIVTMPRNRAVTSPFLQFLENHPHTFPILEYLLGL